MSWSPAGDLHTTFSWDYHPGRAGLLALYERGKDRQWNGRSRLDWSQPVDPDDPLGTPHEAVPIFGSPTWDRLDGKGRAAVLHHLAAWQFSQFLHGEQGGLVCASKLVQAVPDMDSKQFAATQVIDEARHVEVFARFLNEKVGLIYPINVNLQSLFEDIVLDARWDMTYLGLQVLVEGFASAAFGMVRDSTTNPLARALTAYVMEDEARHVAFGRIALRERYRDLTEAERFEREEFCIEAMDLMRARFLAREVWEALELDVDECMATAERSDGQRAFRRQLFARIVPTLKDVGLFSTRMRTYFEAMGVMGFADDSDRAGRGDELVARMLDAAQLRPGASPRH